MYQPFNQVGKDLDALHSQLNYLSEEMCDQLREVDSVKDKECQITWLVATFPPSSFFRPSDAAADPKRSFVAEDS